MHRYYQYTPCFILALASAAANAGAPAFSLGEIVVSAPSETMRITEAVGTVDTVTAEDIRQSGARNLNEAIKLLPGLYVRTGGDGTPRIDIRGLRTRQVLLLLDGVPINSTNDGQFDPSSIDVANIERIKVSRGGSSVLYGAAGSAGVINIITKSGSQVTQGKAMVEFGDNDIRHGQLTVSGGDTEWKGFASASGYHQNEFELSDDYDPVPITGSTDNFQPSGDRINSDRSNTNFYGNLVWSGKSGSEFGASASVREGYYGKPTETRDTTGGDRDDFARRAKFERVDHFEGMSFNLTGKFSLQNPQTTVRPMVYVNQLDELTNGYDDNTFTTQAAVNSFQTDAESTVLGGRLEVAHDWMDSGLSTVAADCHRESWEAIGFEIVAGGGCGWTTTSAIDIDEDVNICSLAVEHEVNLTDQLGLVGGVGYAQQTRDSGSDDNDTTYRIGLFYDLMSDTRLTLSHAKKIRFPTLRDLFEPGRANPNLDSETTYHYEAGVEQSFDRLPLNLGVTLFRVNAEDYIETDGSGIAQNTEKTRFQGVEVTGELQATDNVTLRAGFTFLDSENRSSGVSTRKLQNRPEHQLSVDMNVRMPSVGATLNLSWLHIERSFELERGSSPSASQETGDYDVVDLKLQKAFSGLTVFGRVMNLFDDDYVESGGFPSPGRTLLVGAEIPFGS